jgi:hypothetical protein
MLVPLPHLDCGRDVGVVWMVRGPLWRQTSRHRFVVDERKERAMEQMSSKGEVNAALVLALSGAIAVLVAKGSGPLSLKRVASGILSNPIPRQARSTARGPGASLQRAAA